MKRILSILMILLIISMIIISPIAEDKPKAEGTDYGYLLSQFSPTFWVWFTQVISGMGLTASDLGTQLDYINRNGNIDQYFADLWEQFKTDVKSNWGYANGYLKFTGQLWKDLFAGDPLRSIIGTKEMYDGSTDVNSDYYITEEITYNNVNCIIFESNTSYLTYFNSLSYEDQREIQTTYGINDYTHGNIRFYSYQYQSYPNQYIGLKKLDNGYWDQYGYIFGVQSYALNTSHMYVIPVLSYINALGEPDNNGNIYKHSMIASFYQYNGTTNPIINHTQEFYFNSSVNMQDIYGGDTGITFNNEVLEHEITNEDISENDYILYEINRAYLEQIQDLITKISMNEDTAQDWVLNPPQEVVRVETNNTVIREIIQAGDATIPVELDFPELQDLELPSALITKFPFCIPYDFYRFFQMLNSEPIAPEFTIPFVVGDLIDYEFVLNLDMFDDIIYIVRWFFLALFVLGLIMATRQMIKG